MTRISMTMKDWELFTKGLPKEQTSLSIPEFINKVREFVIKRDLKGGVRCLTSRG